MKRKGIFYTTLHYKELAELPAREGLSSLKLKMEEQGAEEDEHGHEMRRLIG